MSLSLVIVSVLRQSISSDVVKTIVIDFISHQLLKVAQVVGQLVLNIVSTSEAIEASFH